MRIVAIDPGTFESAFVVWEDGVVECGKDVNALLLPRLATGFSGAEGVAIEMIASYGMPVGKEVFETCVWIGRFMEATSIRIVLGPIGVRLVYRREVKMHLCGSNRAKDSNVRQALIDKYGKPGTKANPGKLYGASGDIWAAIGVADFVISGSQPITNVKH